MDRILYLIRQLYYNTNDIFDLRKEEGENQPYNLITYI